MNEEDKTEAYMKAYQSLLFENDDLRNPNTTVKRKCMIQTFTSSINLLDNDATCQVLEKNLNDYVKINKEKLDRYEQKIRNNLAAIKYVPVKVESQLHKVNVDMLMNNPPCYEQGLCKNSEQIDDLQFEHFNKTILRKNKADYTSQTVYKPDNYSNSKEHHNIDTKPDKNTNNSAYPDFKTALEEMEIRNLQKNGNSSNVGQKRSLGMRRTVSNKFVSPMISKNNSNEELPKSEKIVDERLNNIEPRMVELIRSEIMDTGPSLTWDDIAGLEFAKLTIQEIVVWPMLRPDIFTGLRRPPKGILLYGPPGTGKTLIGKCVASQSKSTFFCISASSLTSKWIGDGEKMVRALFTVARCHQPVVIFIDEIDSLLSQRSETEHECTRRIKTEFLVQLDGAATDSEERLLVIGATNRPQELDDAARRRFVKRLYIPLPENNARFQLVQRLMSTEKHTLSDEDIRNIANLTDGFSGADMKTLCSEASMGPIRSIDINVIANIQAAEVRPVVVEDFVNALNRVKSSVSKTDLGIYLKWDKMYGSGSGL